ncbi:hypothetical protein EDD29_7884 [Actinocorallia herbida]|uniref:DUF4190 domain-containing protein n=1 Tax=Actinocorallia herbida TaxID=58109 RepID=A0A3N1D9J3_9ACTN|nr:hypothetical protein [Actinocorallia herbida]ROO90166.1 hypothetical protein EDD29_7884 [Actinocorallia herbida]
MNEQGPATAETKSRAGLRTLWLGLGALILMVWFPPAGFILGVAAVVVAVRTRRAAKGTKTPGVIAGVVMGLIAVLFSAFSLTFSAFLYPELSGLAECQQTVNTETDKQNCKDLWVPKIESKFESVLHLPDGFLEKNDIDLGAYF